MRLLAEAAVFLIAHVYFVGDGLVPGKKKLLLPCVTVTATTGGSLPAFMVSEVLFFEPFKVCNGERCFVNAGRGKGYRGVLWSFMVLNGLPPLVTVHS
jgi:hypothetical protein